jgi:hypothetical protein
MPEAASLSSPRTESRTEPITEASSAGAASAGAAQSDAAAAAPFALQEPMFTEADAAAGRWLAFASATLEEDFARFRGRDRDLIVVLWTCTSLLVVPVKIFFAPQTAQTLYVLYSYVVFFAVSVPVWLATIVCVRRPDDDAARQLALARRLEWNLVAQISAVALLFIAEYTLVYTYCLADAARGRPCPIDAAGAMLVIFAYLHILMKPRLPILLGTSLVYVALTAAATAAFTVTAAVDHVVTAAMLLTATAVFMIDSYVRERAERQSFIEHAALLRAGLVLERLSADARAVVAAALPKELVALDAAAPTSHRSADAAVAVCDIADFANWSCGRLIEDVVVSLHDLMLLVDVSATLNDVANVVSYGDSCVVCAGLLRACDDPLGRVCGFGAWLVEQSSALPFRVRVSACRGALIGGLAGESCKRYVVAGPAFAAAKAALAGVAPGALSVATAGAAPAPLAAPSSDAVAASEADGGGGTEGSAGDGGVPTYSRLWLSFDGADAQAAFRAFEARNFEASKRLMSAIPTMILTLCLGAVLLDFLVNAGAGRRYTRDPALGIGGVAGAVALTLAVALLRRAWAGFPLPADVALYFAAFALYTFSIGPDGEAAHLNVLVVSTLIGTPDLFPRLNWLLQFALITVSMLAVLIAMGIVETRFTDIYFTAVIFGFIRYYVKRLSCQHYVAEAAAALAAAFARAQAERYEKLLAGLLPPHAVPLARRVTDAAAIGGGHVRRQWRGLSVLQVLLGVGDIHDVAVLAAAWRGAASSVAAVPGACLQTVETSGDSFLIAGPFDNRATDEANADAARAVLRLLATLKAVTAPHCPFTAVATAGSAYGALIGYWGLTFRFFGPAVRESNAILAAAPAATGAPLAFASAGFRQQHGNFGVAARPARRLPAGASFAMSLAVAAESTHRDTHGAVSGATAEFGAAANWRIRGVGVARVSTIKLLDIDAVSEQLDAQ